MKNIFSLSLNYKQRVYGLDVFRSIAILLVVITHGSAILQNTILENFPWIRLIDGVDLFFVLSGFLIGSLLLKTLNTSEKFKFNEILTFWKRRWLRTLPLYYLFLLINWLLVNYTVIDGDIKQYNVSFIFFLHNFSSPFYGFFWESWSLSIEEWFYIFLPLILFFLLLLLSAKRAFFICCAILVITPLAYRIYLSPTVVDGFWWDVTFRKMVVTRLDAIGYGIFAAWIKYYYGPLWSKYRIIAFATGLLLLIIAVNTHPEPNSFYAKTFGLTIISLGAMLLVPAFESVKTFSTQFGKVITHISVISYAMYLINLAPISMVIMKQFPPKGGADSLIKYIIYWFLVIVLSTLLHKFFEKPITNLRDRSFRKNNIRS